MIMYQIQIVNMHIGNSKSTIRKLYSHTETGETQTNNNLVTEELGVTRSSRNLYKTLERVIDLHLPSQLQQWGYHESQKSDAP